MHPQGWPTSDVERAVLGTNDWFALPATSVPGGIGPRIWRSGSLGIFASEWVEYEARLYAQSWDKDITRIEVPDAFAEQYGIR
jgi:hypothetical protein